MADETIVKLDDGLYRRRVDGSFGAKLSVIEEIDFYLDNIARFGPVVDVGAYHLAYPQRQLRWLCYLRASKQDLAQRPQALVHARRAWLLDLENLESTIVRNSGDQTMWIDTWRALDAQIHVFELETPELRARLDRLREAPPPTPEGLAEEEDFGAMVRAIAEQGLARLKKKPT